MSRETCGACGTPMIFALSRRSKVQALEREPSPDGNTIVFKVPSGAIECRTAGGEVLEWLRDQGVPLRKDHHATCPEASRF